jgi:rhodanese-related sulfurtransferase
MFVGEANLRPTSPAGWEAMRTRLREAQVAMVSPQELAPMRARGAVLVDVRPREDHARRRIPGARSAPIYRLIDGWSPEQFLRRVGFALFGVLQGTEVNPNFLDELRAAVAEAQVAAEAASSSSPSSSSATTPRVILYCSQGGSIDAVGAAAAAAAAGPVGGGAGGGARGKRGWQSRSLIGAFAVVEAASGGGDGGNDDALGAPGAIGVLRGGLSEWVRGGREVEGEEADADAGLEEVAAQQEGEEDKEGRRAA